MKCNIIKILKTKCSYKEKDPDYQKNVGNLNLSGKLTHTCMHTHTHTHTYLPLLL